MRSINLKVVWKRVQHKLFIILQLETNGLGVGFYTFFISNPFLTLSPKIV